MQPKSDEDSDLESYDLQCQLFCGCSKMPLRKLSMDNVRYKKWCFFISVIIILHYYYNSTLYSVTESVNKMKLSEKHRPKPDELTSYKKFMKYKSRMRTFVTDEPVYTNSTSVCKLNLSELGPIRVNKTPVDLEWVEKQHPEVQCGGFYAPPDCRARHKVAILVPYRDRKRNLAIFLRNIHPFLQKQLIQYRIFVIEQCGTKKFNKGSLYNVAYLETQRFGTFHCLVFHDVDLLPLDSRILYSCPRSPTHMSPSVESQGFQLPYRQLFGGVTVMTPKQFDTVNGYSNSYWNWGAEDDDMFIRLQAKRYPMLRYNASIARYATLPHPANEVNHRRHYYLSIAKRRFRSEGLRSITYKLVNITTRRLFTHILADINPYNTKV